MPLISSRADTGRSRRASALVLAVMAASWTWCEPGSAQENTHRAAPAASPREVPEGLNYANGLFRDRRYELAAEEYERFLQDARPGEYANEARFGAANARLFQGQYDRARRHFEEYLKAAPENPNAASALYRVGETSYMLGDLPAARRSLESFTQSAKGHRNLETAWPYLGEVCLRMRDLPRAKQAYEQALSLYPKGRLADRARFGLGRTLALEGKPDEAVATLRELVEKGGGDWADRGWLQIAQANADARRYDQALRAYEALERVAPKSPLVGEARLGRADALVRLDRRDEAEALLKSLVADLPRNQAAQAASALGTSQLEGGRPAEALATLDAAAGRFAETASGPALLYRAGEAALKLGKTAEARTRFLKASELDPRLAWADYALIRAARLALDAGEKDTANRLAASFADRFPKSPLRADARLIEGQIAYEQKDLKRAIALLSGALADDKPAPETAQHVLYYLGLAYRADGQPKKADEILDSLLKTPAAPAAANAQYLLGQGHFEAKRFAEAIPPLEKYLAANPAGKVAANALAYIAWARLELGQLDLASQTTAKLAQEFPSSDTLPPTRLRLGWALLEKDRAEEAAAAFAALIEAAPADRLAPEAALGRGRALAAARQTDEALKAYELAAEKYPATEQAGLADLARARLLVELKRPALAADVYKHYAEAHTDPARAPKGVEADAVLAEWAWALVDAEKTEEADRIFARLVEEHPQSQHVADARLVLAQSAYDAKSYDRAIELLAPLVAEDAATAPRLLPSALYLWARARSKRGDLEGAAKALDRLITRFPTDRCVREARFLRADVALNLGDAESAEAGFAALAAEPAAETDPERFGVAVRRGRLQSLVALKRWADVLAAAEEFKKLAPRDPLMAEVDYDRGRALQQQARFDDARAAYQAVIDARKGGELAARAQLMRGETYFWQKNYKEALREFFRVRTLYDVPTWQAAALLEAGKVYERQNQWAVAAETYEELRTLFPNDPSAIEAKARLEAARRHANAPADTEMR